jgi:hypothetical protein
MIGSGMTRRRFAQALGGFSLLTAPYLAASAAKGKVYIVQNYLLKNGTQLARWHRFMEQSAVPELKTLQAIYLEAVIAPHMPQAMTIMEFESLDQWRSVQRSLASSASYQQGFLEWETGAEPPYESYSERLLAATDFNPGLSSHGNGSARVFEYRMYHSPAYRQLQALNERFAGPEIAIFHRTGVKPILYTNALSGDALPNLTYLTPFENLNAREKAGAAFTTDPEWLKLRAESVEKYGQISSVMHISLWKPAAYSPVK